ncbi:MAG: LysR family transcriptional regulator [Defluviitaleaceae bacterium]|nr:LysR family transcriptional regulator [Defluviitaleaceae bacterium]
MYLKEIVYMTEIQKYGSITAAAERLFISQAALSKYLKNVEQQVGSPLFSRMGNEMVPTYIGKQYLDSAAKILHVQDNWNLEQSDLLGEERGSINVLIPPMRSSSVIPYVMPRFWNKYPHVEVFLLEESSFVLEKLETHQHIDFAISSNIEPDAGLIQAYLGREEIVLVLPKDHPLAGMGTIREGCRYPWLDIRLIQNEQFVLNPKDQITGRVAAQLFEQAGITPKVLLYTRNNETAIRLAATSRVLTFSPETYIKEASCSQSLSCYSVGYPWSEIKLYASYKRGRYFSSYARDFLDLIREYMVQAAG